MCDDDTERENAAYLAQLKLNRRQWGLGAGAAVATLVAGCKSTPEQGAAATPDANPAAAVSDAAESTTPATAGRMVTVETPDGEAEAFFVAPASGPHPGVVMWPDVAGLRDAFKTMATRLAGQGYAVLAVNPYYRSSKMPILEVFSEWGTDEGKAKIRPMIEALTSEGIANDGAAFVAWLDQQPEVDTNKKIGTTGYCMSGSFTFRTAAAVPERVGVIGSFHGGGLATDEDDSPHKLFAKMNAAALICIGKNDDERDPEAKSNLKRAAEAAGVTAEIEVYPAMHGWCVIDSPVYLEEQAERAWARMLATFEAHL